MAKGVYRLDSRYVEVTFDPKDVNDAFIGNVVPVPENHKIGFSYTKEQISRMYPGPPPIEKSAPTGPGIMEIVKF
jgi:hypothetical protein